VAATFVPPQLATRASKPPTGPGWVHEIKHDGYRMLALVDGRGTRFYSRNKLTIGCRTTRDGRSVLRRFPGSAGRPEAIQRLEPAREKVSYRGCTAWQSARKP
jgi:ATP-dependent DNA ligase